MSYMAILFSMLAITRSDIRQHIKQTVNLVIPNGHVNLPQGFVWDNILFLPYLFLHRLENRTKPISTPYDGRRLWDSNLRTPACKSPALPLCYGRR